MSTKSLRSHALLVRCGKYEFQALGIPAIIAVVIVVVIVALLGALWFGLI